MAEAEPERTDRRTATDGTDRTGQRARRPSAARRSTARRPTPATASWPRTTRRSRPISRPRSRRPPRTARPTDRPAGGRHAAPGTVVVLDFGSQFAQLIARRVRELDVYSELLPHDTPYEELERRGTARDHPVRRSELGLRRGRAQARRRPSGPAGSPSWASATAPSSWPSSSAATSLAGEPPRVRPGERHDHRRATACSPGIDREQPVWMSHGDSITRLPEGFSATAQTDSTPYAGLAAPERNLYGIQFHPEVVHTPRGRDVLRNFVRRASPASRRPGPPANFIETTVAEIRERVDAHARPTGSDGKVICALSGGVDSAVAAALVHRAVGDRLTCIYVDHGLMRKKESELLRVTFERDLGMHLVMVDARERFLARLAGVEDPEQKRRIIGDEFIRVFEEEAGQARPASTS